MLDPSTGTCSDALAVNARTAAELLGVSVGTVENLRQREEIPSVKICARRLYLVSDLVAYLDLRKRVELRSRIAPSQAAEGGAA